MKKNLSFYFFIILPCFIICQSSSLINDIQTWNSVEFQYKKIERTELSLELGLRHDDNLNNFSKFLTDFSLRRSFINYIDYSIGFRFDRKENKDSFDDRIRYYFDNYIVYEVFKNFDLKSRLRYQNQRLLGVSSSQNSINKLRHKISLVNNFRKSINIFLGSEIFYEFGEGFEKYRIFSGLKKRISKNFSASIVGLFQNDFDSNNEKSIFVLKTKLVYSFK